MSAHAYCRSFRVSARRRRATAGRTLCLTVAAVLLLQLALPGTVPAAAAPSEERNGAPKELLVAAAADLRFAFGEIGEEFMRETGIRVVYNFGSTGLLTQQIENGAPFDLFFSADRSYVDRLVERGFGAGAPATYAFGYLALVVPAGEPVPELGELTDAGYEAVAIANPAHAPYGRAAREAFESLGIHAALSDRLVYGENVMDAMRLVETGNADAGLVALAFLGRTEGLAGRRLDTELHQPLEQTALVLAEGAHRERAEAFLDFVTGSTGREILKQHEFGLPAL